MELRIRVTKRPPALLRLGRVTLSLGFEGVGPAALVPCITDFVPESEEWLREIRLDSPSLMVYVVIGSIVARQVLERVPRKRISTVIIHSLDSGQTEEQKPESLRHPSCFVGESGS